MWILPKSVLIKLDYGKPQFLKYQLLDRDIEMRILCRNFSFAVNLDKQNFSIEVDQIKPKFVKSEFLSLYFQM